jgi:transposase
VGEQRQARRLLRRLPARTQVVSADPNYDAYKVYETVEAQGARPVIKPRKNAKRGTIDARGRAIRWWDRCPKTRQRLYGRRVITESVNSSIKRRFGRRLRTHGVIRQRQEFAFRVLAYNTNMVHRAKIRSALTRRH